MGLKLIFDIFVSQILFKFFLLESESSIEVGDQVRDYHQDRDPPSHSYAKSGYP